MTRHILWALGPAERGKKMHAWTYRKSCSSIMRNNAVCRPAVSRLPEPRSRGALPAPGSERRASGKAGANATRDFGLHPDQVASLEARTWRLLSPPLPDRYTNDKYCKSHLLMLGDVKEPSSTWLRLPAANAANSRLPCQKSWKLVVRARCFFPGLFLYSKLAPESDLLMRQLPCEAPLA